MKKFIVSITILLMLLACTPTPESPTWIWVVRWYSQNGHHVLHAKASENCTSADLEGLVHDAIDTVKDRLKPNHGLYIIVEGQGQLDMVIGFTHSAVQDWPDSNPQVLTHDYIPRVAGTQGIWPSDRIPVETIVCNYAWLLGVVYKEQHPWFPELANGRPLPLDSAWIWGK